MKKKLLVFIISILLIFGGLHMVAHADFGDYGGAYDFGGTISSNRDEDDNADDAQAEYRYDYANDDSYNYEKLNNTFPGASNRSASGSRRSVGMIISVIVVINVILILVFLIRRR